MMGKAGADLIVILRTNLDSREKVCASLLPCATPPFNSGRIP